MQEVKPSPAFTTLSRYYDNLYPDKDYVSEVEYICALLERFGNGGRELLEFGSGTGRHARLLGERGYFIEGVERSAEMLSAAKESANFRCRSGDARSVKLGRQFDAVLALFHVLNYQLHDEGVLAFFSNAALHLRRGGILVFDTWYSPAVLQQKPEVRVKHVIAGPLDLTRTAVPFSFPRENRVDINYTLVVRNDLEARSETVTEIHSMRHFCLPELDFFGETCGFKRVMAEAFLTQQAPSETTWGVSVVFRKTK